MPPPPLSSVQAPPADSLRRALEEVFADPEYRWTRGRPLFEWLAERWYALQDWLDRLQAASPLAFKLLLAVLILVLAALIAHIAYVLARVLRPLDQPATAAAAGPARVVDAEVYRRRAEELARAGRFAEALAHRFVAAVLELERADALRFHPSKTPAEYVREARLDPEGRDSLRALVRRLYGHLFGAEPCDDRSYREFGAAADALPRHVAAS